MGSGFDVGGHLSRCAWKKDDLFSTMAKDDKKAVEVDGITTRPDPAVLPARKRLPKELQDTLDNEEKLWEVLYDGT